MNLYSGRKWILAPMVHASCLPLRCECLSYGADVVFSEELIDKKLIQTIRTYNSDFDVIEYRYKKDGRVVFSTCPTERDRLTIQLGTADGILALKAAEHVMNDVTGIDINMGCPKSFSVKGGMGVALMSKPDLVSDILKTLHRNLPSSNVISCKIRLQPTMDQTVQFLRMCEMSGAAAITVHAREPHERPSHRARWDVFKIASESVGVPIIANGDFLRAHDAHRFEADESLHGNCKSIMFARGALWDPSIFALKNTPNGSMESTPIVEPWDNRLIDENADQERRVKKRKTEHMFNGTGIINTAVTGDTACRASEVDGDDQCLNGMRVISKFIQRQVLCGAVFQSMKWVSSRMNSGGKLIECIMKAEGISKLMNLVELDEWYESLKAKRNWPSNVHTLSYYTNDIHFLQSIDSQDIIEKENNIGEVSLVQEVVG